MGIAHKENSASYLEQASLWDWTCHSSEDKCWLNAAFLNTVGIMWHSKLRAGRSMQQEFLPVYEGWYKQSKLQQRYWLLFCFLKLNKWISGNVTGILWPRIEGCRGNVFCGCALQIFFQILRAEINLLSPVVTWESEFPELNTDVLFVYCLGICLRKGKVNKGY